MKLKLWLLQCIDEAVHAPGLNRLFPDWFQQWACDKFDEAFRRDEGMAPRVKENPSWQRRKGGTGSR